MSKISEIDRTNHNFKITVCKLNNYYKGEIHEGDKLKDVKIYNNKGKEIANCTFEKIDIELNGKGKIKYENSDVYDGEIKGGIANGYGKIKYENGDVYEGEFKDGKPDGENVVIKYSDNTYYEGIVKDGELKEGTIYINGKNYKVENSKIKDGIKLYNGIKIGKSEANLYIDDKLNIRIPKDIKNGPNLMISPDGTVYEGEFLDGKQNGQGRYIRMEPETKKELYTEIYNNKEIMDKVEYVYKENSKQYKIVVDYNEINKKLNKGEINNFNELFGGKSKCIVIEGNDDNELLNNFEIIRKCGQYQMQTRLKGENNKLDNENRMRGGHTGLQNLLILSGLESLESLKRIRFRIIQNNPDWLTNIYKDAEELLNSYGLTIKRNLSKDSNLVSIFDKNLQEVDYITTNAITTTKDHAVNITIDIKKIRETLEKGETPDVTNFIYGYDSSRVIGDTNYKKGKYKEGLGKITKNCKFYNHNQQELGSCWYNASCSTLTAAENPDIINRIRDGEIEQILIENAKIESNTQINDSEFNDFEILQMKRLQTLAENLEVKRLGLKKENKKLTSKNNRPRMIRQIVKQNIRKKLKELAKKEKFLEENIERIGTFKILMMLAEKIGLTIPELGKHAKSELLAKANNINEKEKTNDKNII